MAVSKGKGKIEASWSDGLIIIIMLCYENIKPKCHMLKSFIQTIFTIFIFFMCYCLWSTEYEWICLAVISVNLYQIEQKIQKLMRSDCLKIKLE